MSNEVNEDSVWKYCEAVSKDFLQIRTFEWNCKTIKRRHTVGILPTGTEVFMSTTRFVERVVDMWYENNLRYINSFFMPSRRRCT